MGAGGSTEEKPVLFTPKHASAPESSQRYIRAFRRSGSERSKYRRLSDGFGLEKTAFLPVFLLIVKGIIPHAGVVLLFNLPDLSVKIFYVNAKDNRADDRRRLSRIRGERKFPRSTYYKALVCVPSNRQKEYETFGQEVKRAYEDSKQRYGAVRICRILNDGGTSCSVKRVQRHMAEQGLRFIVVKKYNHHASHGTIPNGKVNILKRDFQADTIHQKWCTDITYIHVQKEGWTYLASVMDLCSRKIIGYVYGTSIDTKGILLHSDLGSQYTSQVFEDCLNRKGIVHSFSRKGNPYDYACIEFFHLVLKKEEIYFHTYQDTKEARRAIFEYIDGWYKRKRIHSAIGYITPRQKEDEEIKKAA